MKKLLLVALLLGGLTSSRGQGFVVFDNTTTWLQSPPDRLVRFTNATALDASFIDGSPVFTNANNVGLRAQLYYGASTASEGSLIPVSTAPAMFRSSTSASVGSWLGGQVILPQFNLGDILNLQVRVWDINLAQTYGEAETFALSGNYPGLLGKSLLFSYRIPTEPTPDAGKMINFQGFNIEFIPEPSCLSLGFLGLIILARRWMNRGE